MMKAFKLTLPLVIISIGIIAMGVFVANLDFSYHKEIHVAKEPIISSSGGVCVVKTADNIERQISRCGYKEGDTVIVEYYLSDNISSPHAFIITEQHYNTRIKEGYSTP